MKTSGDEQLRLEVLKQAVLLANSGRIQGGGAPKEGNDVLDWARAFYEFITEERDED